MKHNPTGCIPSCAYLWGILYELWYARSKLSYDRCGHDHLSAGMLHMTDRGFFLFKLRKKLAAHYALGYEIQALIQDHNIQKEDVLLL